ncbi:MAG: hypothetical protein RBT06_06350 [Smithellaceae bacterium]|nr:hypothetical protein [Smithellaceae bacterium]
MIRIIELIEYKQPYILRYLRKFYPVRRPAPLVPLWVEGLPFSMWREMMEERPKNGIGGLLAGEEAEVVGL